MSGCIWPCGFLEENIRIDVVREHFSRETDFRVSSEALRSGSILSSSCVVVDTVPCVGSIGCYVCLQEFDLTRLANTNVERVSIPDSVREICDKCFYRCGSLRRVTFGFCSCLERLGVS